VKAAYRIGRGIAEAAIVVGSVVGILAASIEARAAEAPVARVWLSPQPTGETLRAIWGSEKVLWAIGDAGTVLKSADHGGFWLSVESGTTQNLKAIWGSTEGDLWIAGDGETILRSTDGGAGWHRLIPPGGGNLAAVWGSEAHDVYFAGSNGQLLHTEDHGRSFTTIRPLGDTDEQLTAIWGTGNEEICVSGDRGSIVASSDRGQTWNAVRKQTMRPLAAGQPAPAKATPAAVTVAPLGGSSALSITGTRRGDWLAVVTSWTATRKGNTGASGVQHTADGGKSWKEPHIEPTPAPWPGFHAFHPADDHTVYGVATFEQWDRPVEERQRVGLIVSRDGGATFERRSFLPRGGGVNALWRDSTGPLIAVGPLGLILRSRDDGRTWEESSTHPFGAATLRSSWSDGAGQVWVVGDDCTVLHSSDGGSRFEAQRPCPAGAGTDVRSVWGSNAEDVYIAGSFVSRTVDRGAHWAVVSPPAPVATLWHVWGSDATDLYAAGYGVWRSTNNAQSWRMVNGSRSRTSGDWFSGLFGIGNDRFSFTETGRLERGSKTGASWQGLTPPVPAWRAGAFWSEGTLALWALGPNHGLYRSTDAGKTFQAIVTPLGKSTTFIAMRRREDQLYLLADDPLASPTPLAPSAQLTVLVSSDEGLSWSPYATVPAGGVALGVVEKDLLIIGANGQVVRLH
jgi:photosystem II stability/assembly factor-like uncharacterized protein